MVAASRCAGPARRMHTAHGAPRTDHDRCTARAAGTAWLAPPRRSRRAMAHRADALVSRSVRSAGRLHRRPARARRAQHPGRVARAVVGRPFGRGRGAEAAPRRAEVEHAARERLELTLMGVSSRRLPSPASASRRSSGCVAGRLRTRWPQTFAPIHRLLLNKYYVDELYNATIVQPIKAVRSRGCGAGSTCASSTAPSTAPARSSLAVPPCCGACRPDRSVPMPGRCSSGVDPGALAYYLWQMTPLL